MTAFGFAEAVARIETRMTADLSLTPDPLRPGLATAEGAWKGDAVRIVANAWNGPVVRFARFVRLTSPVLDIGNLLVLPRPPSAAPIFGADLVAARPDAGLIVADLSPVDGVPAPSPNPGLPEWTAGIFSASPMFVRVTVDETASALAAVEAMARTFMEALRRGAPLPDGQVADAHRRYLSAHRRDDKMMTMLAHIFGPAWTADFVDAVLFPVLS